MFLRDRLFAVRARLVSLTLLQEILGFLQIRIIQRAVGMRTGPRHIAARKCENRKCYTFETMEVIETDFNYLIRNCNSLIFS